MNPGHHRRSGKIFDEGWRAGPKTVNDGLMAGVLRTGKPAGDECKTSN
jgi:hypothetical protein